MTDRYFDPLGDLVDQQILTAAGQAMDRHNHRPGARDEPTLIAGMRGLIIALRSQQQAQLGEEVRRLREHHERMEAARAGQHEQYKRSFTADVRAAVAQRDAVVRVALTARRLGRKTVKLDDLLTALSMHDWRLDAE